MTGVGFMLMLVFVGFASGFVTPAWAGEPSPRDGFISHPNGVVHAMAAEAKEKVLPGGDFTGVRDSLDFRHNFWSCDATTHSFSIEYSGRQSNGPGPTISQGTRIMIYWDPPENPETILGYNVMRSTSGLPGTFIKCNTTLLIGTSYLDTGLMPNTDYFYIVYVVDNGMNTLQWTPPFFGHTGENRTAASDWTRYR